MVNGVNFLDENIDTIKKSTDEPCTFSYVINRMKIK